MLFAEGAFKKQLIKPKFERPKQSDELTMMGLAHVGMPLHQPEPERNRNSTSEWMYQH